jgi:lipopolysaccharide biosynthesis protein
MNVKARAIAFYLPQYHPIHENDEWWGKGFTEWTNTAKAKPLFRDHYQPHVPADLGFYDLRLSETRIAQATLARQYGIKGFCYYHYWFAGKRLLERPFNEVLESGQPSFPFCLCWANATWTGIWHGAPDRVLIEQTYPGQSDYEAHFEALLPAFRDPRYITVDGKPLFLVYRPLDLPDAARFASIWKGLAAKSGLPGLFLVGVKHNNAWLPENAGFDAAVLQKLPFKVPRIPWKYPLLKAHQFIKNTKLTIYEYGEIADTFVRNHNTDYLEFPCVIPNWDNTPRSGMNGLVLHNSTPGLFKKHLAAAIQNVSSLSAKHRIIFLKSWNEWAEGNHLEPDQRFGKAYLEALRDALVKTS